jgi:hypothetical protein
MTHSSNLPSDVERLLDTVGGEPLTGSGFEDEQPEPGFTGSKLGVEELGPVPQGVSPVYGCGGLNGSYEPTTYD